MRCLPQGSYNSGLILTQLYIVETVLLILCNFIYFLLVWINVTLQIKVEQGLKVTLQIKVEQGLKVTLQIKVE